MQADFLQEQGQRLDSVLEAPTAGLDGRELQRDHWAMMKERVKGVVKASLRTLPAELRERVIMTAFLQYFPNIRKPTTFNEKVAHRKLHQYDPRFNEYADKWKVREHVSRIVGASYLNELYATVTDVDELDLPALPDRFVAKPTHGSKALMIVDGKAELDRAYFLEYMKAALRQDLGEFQSEYWYGEIPRRIVVEERLTDDRFGVPLDFKFYVFHGRPEYVHVDFDRYSGHRRTMYDREWGVVPVRYVHPIGPSMERPKHLDEMLRVAEALGADFDFVRVDLYAPNDQRVVFGEMTFAPEGGRRRFVPRSFDFELGRLW